MTRHLYFVCPTDYLESIIANTFQQKTFFYTSLANSVELNWQTVQDIAEFILTKKVQAVTFVLSRGNKILLDAIRSPHTGNIQRMFPLYNKLEKQLGEFQIKNQIADIESIILSHYLTDKVNQLASALSEYDVRDISVTAKIYNPISAVFLDSRVLSFDFHQFNLN